MRGWHEFAELATTRLDWLGQPVILAIFAASLLMWTLILERYLFVWWQFPRARRRLIEQWCATVHADPLARRLRRQSLIAGQQRALQRGLPVLRALVAVLPLLGLFGTVSGMSLTFEALGARDSVEADLGVGISRALTSTLAGLVCALPGLYFSASLQRRSQTALAGLASHLEH